MLVVWSAKVLPYHQAEWPSVLNFKKWSQAFLVEQRSNVDEHLGDDESSSKYFSSYLSALRELTKRLLSYLGEDTPSKSLLIYKLHLMINKPVEINDLPDKGKQFKYSGIWEKPNNKINLRVYLNWPHVNDLTFLPIATAVYRAILCVVVVNLISLLNSLSLQFKFFEAFRCIVVARTYHDDKLSRKWLLTRHGLDTV